MTKINKKNRITLNIDMQTHINDCYQLIENKLPSCYADLVLEKLKADKTLKTQIIRNVKNRITEFPTKRIAVLNALVEVSQEYMSNFTKKEEKDNI